MTSQCQQSQFGSGSDMATQVGLKLLIQFLLLTMDDVEYHKGNGIRRHHRYVSQPFQVELLGQETNCQWWRSSKKVCADPLTGYMDTIPVSGDFHDAHNIYYQVLRGWLSCWFLGLYGTGTYSFFISRPKGNALSVSCWTMTYCAAKNSCQS
jgi:hypothetical protein